MVSLRWPWTPTSPATAAASRYAAEVAGFLAAQAAPPPPAVKRRRPSGEAAPLELDPQRLGESYLGISEPQDSNLRHQSPRDFDYDYLWGLYEEPLDKDALLRGVMKQRNSALLGKSWRVMPAKASPAEEALALDIAAFCEAALTRMSGLREARKQLNTDWYWGNVYADVVWEAAPRDLLYIRPLPRRPGQRSASEQVCFRQATLPARIEVRHPRRFRFTPGGELRLMDDLSADGSPLPAWSMLLRRRERRFDDHYGAGDARPIWWWTKFKADGIRWLLHFLEKWPLPKAKLTHPPDPSPQESENWRKVVTSLAGTTGITLPSDVSLELLQIASTGGADLYIKFAEYCDKQITLAVQTQTLTTQQGDKGARALGEVHLEVRQEIIDDDAAYEAECFGQLLSWLVEWNFGADKLHLAPRWHVELDPPTDATAALDRFIKALDAGVDVSEEQVREECNLLPPLDETDSVLAQRLARALPLAPTMQPSADPEEGGPAPPPSGGTARSGELWLDFVHPPSGRLQAEDAGAALPRSLRDLYDSGVAACSRLLSELPASVRDQFAALANAALGEDWAEQPLSPVLLSGWEKQLRFSATTRADFIERLNDDLTITALTARGKLAAQLPASTQAARLRAAEAVPPPGSPNPSAEGLFDLPRLVPSRVLDVLSRKVSQSLSFEDFYKLDALARGSAFTAWDLLEADVRHLGSALEDAVQQGWTTQQFADYVYDRLQARYVQQGSSLHAWHVETIYHTNMATAYNQSQMDEQFALRDSFPYIEFLNPDPQFETCRYCAGKIWPASSEVWRRFTPPLHFNCGSFTRALSQARFEELQREEGKTVELQEPLYEPEVYAGPRDPATGEPAGSPQPFGAWAPLDERYSHLRSQRIGVAP